MAGVTLRQVITRWGFDVDDTALINLEQQTKKLQTQFAKLGAVATAALASIVVPAAMIEDELRKSAAAAGKTGDDFEATLQKIAPLAQNFAEELGISGTKVAAGFFDVISAGVDPLTKGFEDFARTGLSLAKVAGGDVGQAIEQLKPTMQAFGIATQDAIIVADKFARANQIGATSIAQIAEGMIIAAPIISQTMGQTLDTTTALLIGFAEAGFKARRGGEGLKQVALALAAPTTRAADAIAKLGIETTDSSGNFLNMIDIIRQFETRLEGMTKQQKATSLEQIFGRETVGKFSALLAIGSDKLAEFEKKSGESDGALALTLEQMEGTTEAPRRLFESVKNLAISLGAPLLGPLKGIADSLRGMVRAIRDVVDENPELAETVVIIFGFSAASVALGSALGIVALGAKLLIVKMKALGTAAVIAQVKMFLLPIAIAAAAIALALLMRDFIVFARGGESLLGDLFKAFDELNNEVGVFGDVLKGIFFAAPLLIGLLMGPLAGVVALLVGIIFLSALIIDKWELLKEFPLALKLLWEDVKNSILKVLDDIAKKISDVFGIEEEVIGQPPTRRTAVREAVTTGAQAAAINALRIIPGIGAPLAGLITSRLTESETIPTTAAGVPTPAADAASTVAVRQQGGGTGGASGGWVINAPVEVNPVGNVREIQVIARDEIGNVVGEANREIP